MMKKIVLLTGILAMSMIASGCVGTTTTLVPPDAGVTLAAHTQLTEQAIKNGTYTLSTGKTATLVDGKLEEGSEETYVSVTILEPVAMGDMNSDGVEDAAVLLAENMGGSGTFVYLVPVLNLPAGMQAGTGILVDDRASIRSLSVVDQKPTLRALIHGSADPMCCPNFDVALQYARNDDNTFSLISEQSLTADGKTRRITITEATVSDPTAKTVTVKGDVTIAPFENQLVYRVVDSQGNQLAEGPVTVAAAEMGGAGTFDATISLATVMSGQTVRIVLLDLDAANGSPLTLESAWVTLE